MERFEVVIEDTGERFACARDRNLLQAMSALGRRGIPVGCRNGGCGVCVVQVVHGGFAVQQAMSRAHVSADDEAAGRVLACRVQPTSDLRVSVGRGLLRKAVCATQPTANERRPATP